MNSLEGKNIEQSVMPILFSLLYSDEDSGSDHGYFGTPSPEHKRKRPKSECS